LRTKELTKFRDLKDDDSGQGLNISSGRSENKGREKGKKHRSNAVTTQSSNVTTATPLVTLRRIVLREGVVVVVLLGLS
jgi:hypothetical protein